MNFRPIPIAIVGMAGRFPGGASTPAALEKLLHDEVDAVGPIPETRWRHANVQRNGYVPGWVETNQAGLLSDPTLFDADFFGISAREACSMDPQQRLMLECAYDALQDAGVSQAMLRQERVAVMVGATLKDYARLQGSETSDGSTVSGTAPSMLANRISYALDLRGPSWTIDTACSSSLSALHAACRSLGAGECDRAVVGGVNLILSIEEFIFFSNAGMLSPDGRCRAFDREGQGYVRAEGVAALVLKRLEDTTDDRVHAVILNTGANQDGRSIGLTVPSVISQTALLRQVYAEIGLGPEDVGYVEAHGTGTPVGDPVEAEAIGTVLGSRHRPLPIGSIKTNIGHLEGASGLAGLFKAVFVARSGRVPASLHFNHPHPDIDFAGLGLKVASRPLQVALPTVVGLCSFGLGGSNAHAVIATAPAPPSTGEVGRGPWLLPVSSGSKAGYANRARQLEAALPETDRGAFCHMASERSFHHPYRTASVIGARGPIRLPATPVRSAAARPLVFSYCGQGAIWPESGRELSSRERVFRETLEECEVTLASNLDDLSLSVPLLCALQIALTRLWGSWGVRPAAVVAHSAGIAAAAWAAGVVSVADAMAIARHRGRLMQQLAQPGRMLAVQLEASQIRALPNVVVAAYNGPTSTVLSGPADVLDAYAAELAEQGTFARSLMVATRFHHPSMAAVAEPLRDALAGIELREPSLPIYSSVLGRRLSLADLRDAYMSRSAVEPVRFLQATRALVADGYHAFLEVGPHPVLSGGIRDVLDEAGEKGIVLPGLTRGRPEREALLETAARLYEGGHELEWGALNPRGAWLDLPAYPWAHQSYWSETRESYWSRRGPVRHPLLGLRIRDERFAWDQELSELPHLAEHRLGTVPAVSGSTFIAMAAAAWGRTGLRMDEVRFQEMALVPEGSRLQLRTSLENGRVRFLSNDLAEPDRWTLHASARVSGLRSGQRRRVDLAALQERCPVVYTAEAYCKERPNSFGRTGVFDCIEWLRRGNGEVLLKARGPVDERFLLHPGWLDACFYGAAALTPSRTNVPVGIEQLRLYRPHTGDVVAHLREVQSDARSARCDLTIADTTGEVVLELIGYSTKTLDNEAEREGGWVGAFWETADCPATGALTGALATVGGDLPNARRFAWGDDVREHARVVAFAEDLKPLVALVQSLLPTRAQLTVVTRGSEEEPSAGAIWGWMRSVASEHPSLRVRLVDAESEGDVLRELAGDDGETEVRWRNGVRQVQRLRFATAETLQAQAAFSFDGDFRLEADGSGNLEKLHLAPFRPRDPGPGEVQVRVEAAALNFADLMKSLNLLPGREGQQALLGAEAAGTVCALGSGVSGVGLGERVMALGRPAFSSVMTTRADYVVPLGDKPLAAHAGLPIVFLTAIYSLCDLARLRSHERVLIHSAAGGLGLAALQVARRIGAEIYATAGTAAKREWLLTQGVRACFDSRSPAWADEIPDGVDVILSSLAGEHIAAGLELLRPYGRFVEVGKRDVWGGTEISLRPFRRNLSYFAVDLEDAIEHRPELIVDLLARMRDYGPLPFSERPMTEAVEAFREMTRGEHIGKLVLTRPPGPVVVQTQTWSGPLVRSDATYLVVGTRGAGLATGIWLAAQGAQHLLFISPSGQLDRARLGKNVSVEVAAIDVADPEALAALLRQIPPELPLRGVVQAAMVLDDALVSEVTPERLERVLRPKVQGSWNLHTLTADLDFFVMFSSVASLLGSPGQSAYCAANASMDSLAHHRHRRGLPALSVNWPALADFGALARDLDLADYLERGGLRSLGSHAFFVHLEAALRARVPQVGVILRAGAPLRGFALTPRVQPLFADGPQVGPDLRLSPRQAVQADPSALAELLEAQVARILRVSRERLDVERPLVELGMDSLMTLELRNWLVESFGVSLAELRTPSLAELADTVAGRLGSAVEPLDEIDAMSDEEVEAMLAQLTR